MIGWLQSLDAGLFHFINTSLGNPFFDRLMPFVGTSPWFACILLAIAVVMMWKGGAPGRICTLMLALSLFFGNWLVGDTIKHAVARTRPFHVEPRAILRISMGDSYSFPSSHSANWFSAALVLLVYYRRSIWVMLPLAATVAFSRVYNGVHYPSDVLGGAVLGAGYTAAVILVFDGLWLAIGPRWFPLWHARLPSLVHAEAKPAPPPGLDDKTLRDAYWLRLGYLLAAFLLLFRLIYLATGKIELSEDEAYQWLWSKHPALSYYSKPLLIAWAQFFGTHLWGDNEFGVRFLSPIITAVISVLVLRFMARAVSGRAAFVLTVIMTATPLLSLGSIVMTVDPLSVLFWIAAMIAGWQAAGPAGATRHWLWTGLWIGLGFLAKYTNLAQLACWIIFFLLWAAARAHLRKPGPWLALLTVGVCTLPVMIWNAQHDWITVAHVASDGQFGEKWRKIFTFDFLMGEFWALNPFFFVAAIWAGVGFWRMGRKDPFQLYLFSMGGPLFLAVLVLSVHTHIETNWIAPAIVPMFCLMTVYWAPRWARYKLILRPLLCVGAGLGLFAVVLAHDTRLIGKLIHRDLPAARDPLRRVHGWKEMAQIVDQERVKMEAEGHPVFIICEHYGFTSELSFYMPEAKSRVKSDPLVHFLATPKPINQFYFWPSYLDKAGQNALFVHEVERPHLRPDWLGRWWHGEGDLYLKSVPPPGDVPTEIRGQFTSVHYLGQRDVVVNGDIVRRIELFECRDLKTIIKSP